MKKIKIVATYVAYIVIGAVIIGMISLVVFPLTMFYVLSFALIILKEGPRAFWNDIAKEIVESFYYKNWKQEYLEENQKKVAKKIKWNEVETVISNYVSDEFEVIDVRDLVGGEYFFLALIWLKKEKICKATWLYKDGFEELVLTGYPKSSFLTRQPDWFIDPPDDQNQIYAKFNIGGLRGGGSSGARLIWLDGSSCNYCCN